MIRTRICLQSLVPLILILASGCAPTYHSYSGCHVECKYCAPEPLPYSHYKGCVCHSCAAAKYLALPAQPIEENSPSENDGDGVSTE